MSASVRKTRRSGGAGRQGCRGVKLDRERWNELIAVNSEVNARIRPVTDIELFGVEEYWTYPVDGAGDARNTCWKRSACCSIAAGPQRPADHRRQGHQQRGPRGLTVRTDQGDVILDNQIEAVLPWYSAPYRFVKRQSTSHPAKWAAISDLRTSTLASIGN